MLVNALVTIESQRELLSISTSHPVSTGGSKKPPLSTIMAATAERSEQFPLSTIKKAKRSKQEKPHLPSLPSTSRAAFRQCPEQPKQQKQQTPLLSSMSGHSPPDARPEERPSTSNSHPASATTLLHNLFSCGAGRLDESVGRVQWHPGHSTCAHQPGCLAGLCTEPCGRIVVVSIHTVHEEDSRPPHRAGR
ncbi:hypothetical protein UPYG_G00354590 [Umbra pygmaea]|uniref:Uncharacterized protein n=1 Tax=Umbra pygmaea TaxID=75934 RepID=A0ABD0VZC9_UMBPY